MELSLALQHCRVCRGAGRAVVPPKTATSSPMCPSHPNPSEGGQGEGSGCFPIPQGRGNRATNPQPLLLQLATQDPGKRGNVGQKREFQTRS